MIQKILSLSVLCSLLFSFSVHAQTVEPTDTSSSDDGIALPGNPVPDEPTTQPPHDGDLMQTPALSYTGQAGYLTALDEAAASHGAQVVAGIFMDGGRTSLLLNVEGGAMSTGSDGSPIGFGGGAIAFRYRFPIDRQHIAWWGLGTDIQGRGSNDPRFPGFFALQLPEVFLGIMRHLPNHDCEVQLFGKTGFGIYDSRTANTDWHHSLDTMARPMLGLETSTSCRHVRFRTDYQHIFSAGDHVDTDLLSFSLEHLFPIERNPELNIGYYVRGSYWNLGGLRSSGSSILERDHEHYGSASVGLEVRWGASPRPRTGRRRR